MSKLTEVNLYIFDIDVLQLQTRETVRLLEAQARPLLYTLTKDELYNLSLDCDVEGDADHCLRCTAWAIYVGMD